MAYDAGTILGWKPNKWVAAALGLFLGPLGLQYAGAPRRAALVVVGLLTVGMTLFFVGGFSAQAAQPVQYGLAIATAIWAHRIAMAAEPVVQPHWSTRWYGLLATFAVFAAVAVLLRLVRKALAFRPVMDRTDCEAIQVRRDNVLFAAIGANVFLSSVSNFL